MIKDLSRKEECFASTEDEALDIVENAQDGENGEYIIGQSILKKSNKNGEYWLVNLDYKFNTPAGIMETDQEQVETIESEDEK
ncbi:hypothetical protein R6Z02_12960 [Carnobacterium maltaromaticum]|uniref:hypothetical protein n=1 Tax=Carnobacterium maltaromaticum TaxID=2751 RepID=UPI00298B7A13|nr:hypothetical protein [Carnobacterium maltaromaticum]MDW5524662.1 hypothetical protein [Carnobacterium maltaromaticum]